MAKKKSIRGEETESVKLKTAVVDLVRENKRKTRMPIAAFFEEAAIEKLKRDNK